MNPEQRGFYDTLRQRLLDWTGGTSDKESRVRQYIMLAPDFFCLLCRLMMDKDVSPMHKAKVALAIAYFMSPIDLLPEALLGPLGYVDDVALAAFVLNGIVNDVDPEVVRRHWPGQGDVLDKVSHIVSVADQLLGAGLWKHIVSCLDKGSTPGRTSCRAASREQA
ncbi:MAG: DUF1232 domain-containing protein [Lentisphaerae bacterium]|nr:DUF1232 domain-containing protein [Lentisphaerota bacterium]MBT4814399.1 DUF1232 domain-containing protein [Lentisphaerota bacterium]MBT5608956.1 DUF1232 domain-containing protein [Lentisphaerota bacterium]MBT7061495.1 DUF1232 domain-containing protein [Lentisphaerota bacterium]MBT7845025.1 DUF1232 domain-containing protein [Lentisphaerota bacterium]